jgi:hypothetical protein
VIPRATAVLLIGAVMACRSESTVTHERSDDVVAVTPKPKPPWLDPGAGPDGLTRTFSGSITALWDPPLRELAEHLPAGRPVELSEDWARMEGPGVPSPYVQRCIASGHVVESVAELAALLDAAAARGWKRVDREETIEFLDERDDRVTPLTIMRIVLRQPSPIPGVDAYTRVVQCEALDASLGGREFEARRRSDWRFTPLDQLATALGHEPMFLHFGRRGDRVFAGGTVTFESSDGTALSEWIDSHGFVRDERGIYVATGEGFEVTISMAGWDGGGLANVTTTAL